MKIQSIQNNLSLTLTPAKLNCIVDADTSYYMASDLIANDLPPVLSSSAANLKVNGVVVTSMTKDVMRDASSCTDTQIYIRTKTGWTFDMMNQVQWKAIGSTFDSLSLFNKTLHYVQSAQMPMKTASICFNANTKQLALLGYT
eukprot:5611404-Ditylum_brightwellii.AAC.1